MLMLATGIPCSTQKFRCSSAQGIRRLSHCNTVLFRRLLRQNGRDLEKFAAIFPARKAIPDNREQEDVELWRGTNSSTRTAVDRAFVSANPSDQNNPNDMQSRMLRSKARGSALSPNPVAGLECGWTGSGASSDFAKRSQKSFWPVDRPARHNWWRRTVGLQFETPAERFNACVASIG